MLGAATEEHHDHLVIPLLNLEKQARSKLSPVIIFWRNLFSSYQCVVSAIRGHIRISAFTEDETICPVSAIKAYQTKVHETNKQTNKLQLKTTATK